MGNDCRLEFTPFDWSCDYYLRHGRMMDADAVGQLAPFDAIYLGAIGDPRVADHVSAGELLLPLRRRLVQYVNLRPVRLLPGIVSPLAGRGAADMKSGLAAMITGQYPHQNKVTSNDPPMPAGMKPGEFQKSDAFRAGRDVMNQYMEAVPTLPRSFFTVS